MDFFDCLSLNPTINSIFNDAMSSISTIILQKVLDNYKGFEGLEVIVDVGGGIGASINMIVSKYPSIQGINFDLPHVIQNAPTYPGKFGYKWTR